MLLQIVYIIQLGYIMIHALVVPSFVEIITFHFPSHPQLQDRNCHLQ